MSEQKWREVWESVDGNCWHEREPWIEPDHGIPGTGKNCAKCGEYMPWQHDCHPPLTLDALFEVAGKLGLRYIFSNDLETGEHRAFLQTNFKTTDIGGWFYTADTPQLALLEALWQATEHRRK